MQKHYASSCSACISSGFRAPALLQTMLAHCLQNWVMATTARHLADFLVYTICAFDLLSEASSHCMTSTMLLHASTYAG